MSPVQYCTAELFIHLFISEYTNLVIYCHYKSVLSWRINEKESRDNIQWSILKGLGKVAYKLSISNIRTLPVLTNWIQDWDYNYLNDFLANTTSWEVLFVLYLERSHPLKLFRKESFMWPFTYL